MNKYVLLAGVATMLFAMNAQATEISPYVSAKLRYADMSNEFDFNPGDKFDTDDNVFGGSLAVGISAKTATGTIRAELEYNKNSDAEKTHDLLFDEEIGHGKFTVESQSYMANLYYDFDTNTPFMPYVGIGAGLAKVKGKLSGETETYILGGSMSDTHFAWQAGVGVNYALNQNVSLDLGYRYVDYGDFTEDDVKLDMNAHEVYLGLRYNF